jgi:hypothetical protein
MTREQRGYGYPHRVARSILLPAAIGTPCPLCGELMLSGQALDLDHRVRLVDDATSVADRIVHAKCNRGRGVGHRIESVKSSAPPRQHFAGFF